MGLSCSYRIDGHIKLEGIGKYFPGKVKKTIDLAIEILSVFVFAIIAFSAIYTMTTNYKSTTPTISIPFWIFFLPTILGFTFLTAEHLKKVYKILKKDSSKWE
jgi:TRAP-type C4-dicarboxylate transport system permease small subunit